MSGPYRLMQSDLEFAAFLDHSSKYADRIQKHETKPKSHQERVMVRYLISQQKQADTSTCRCGHNRKEATA